MSLQNISTLSREQYQQMLSYYGKLTSPRSIYSYNERYKKSKYKPRVISYFKNYITEIKNIVFSTETINNYQLYDYNNDLTNEEIKNLHIVWKNNFELEKEEFFDICKNNMNANWNKYSCNSIKYEKFWIKTDINGVYEPEDLIENNNAGELTLNDNIEELWKLPYPKEFIIRIIMIAQNKHKYGVRHINYLCELFKRIIDNNLEIDDNFDLTIEKTINKIASKFPEKEINIVAHQSIVTFEEAIIALNNNNGDIVNAIMELTM